MSISRGRRSFKKLKAFSRFKIQGKRKREGGKKISSKDMGEKGIVVLKSDTKVM